MGHSEKRWRIEAVGIGSRARLAIKWRAVQYGVAPYQGPASMAHMRRFLQLRQDRLDDQAPRDRALINLPSSLQQFPPRRHFQKSSRLPG